MARSPSFERILQFRLGTDKRLVNREYRGLITSALYEKPAESPDDVNNTLVHLFRINPLPPTMISKYLAELLGDGTICLRDGNYTLTQLSHDQLQSIIDSRRETRALLHRNMLSEIQGNYGHLDDDQQRQIEALVDDVVVTFFTAEAKLFLGYLSPSAKLVFDIPELLKIIHDKADHMEDPGLRRAIEEGMKTEFLKSEPTAYRFLLDMFQIYTYFEILNLDPECRIKLNIDSAYLDTNVLLDLLLPTRTDHDLALDHIRLAKQLPLPIRYTVETKKEFQRVIRDYSNFYGVPETTLRKWKEEEEDGLLQAFLYEKKNNPSLTFEGYCIWLLKTFEQNLKEKFGVLLDQTEHDPATFPELERFASILSEGARLYKKWKSLETVRHDAVCLSLMRELQGKKRLTWFITDDKTLFHLSKALIERREISCPLSISSDVWLQALTFLYPLGEEKSSLAAFKRLLLSPLSPSLKPISVEELVAVAYPWLKTDLIDPQTLTGIVSERFIEDYLTAPQEKADISMIKFEEKMKAIIDNSIGEQIDKLTADKKALEEETSRLKGELAKTKTDPIKVKALFYLGCGLLIYLVLLVSLSALQQRALDPIACGSLTTMVLAFIGSSIFGEEIYRRLRGGQ